MAFGIIVENVEFNTVFSLKKVSLLKLAIPNKVTQIVFNNMVSAKCIFFSRIKLDDYLSRILTCHSQSAFIFFIETKRIPFATLRVYLFLLNVIANARITNASRTGKM